MTTSAPLSTREGQLASPIVATAFAVAQSAAPDEFCKPLPSSRTCADLHPATRVSPRCIVPAVGSLRYTEATARSQLLALPVWFGKRSSWRTRSNRPLIYPAWLLMTQDQGNICVTNNSTGRCHAFERSRSFLRVRPRERMMPMNEMRLALGPPRPIRSTHRRTWAAIETGLLRRPTPTMSHFR
jgi:hypothetical protein